MAKLSRANWRADVAWARVDSMLVKAAQMASAKDSSSLGATRCPAFAGLIRSGVPPTAVAMAGSPVAMASCKVQEVPSVCEGSTKQSSMRRTSGMSLRAPASQAYSVALPVLKVCSIS